MGLLNLTEMIQIVRKYLLRILALSLAVGCLSWAVVESMQTYTATLQFKYNYEEASEGLAPDGESKLDPYEMQNPVVIQGAIEALHLDNDETIGVEGIRENITISEIITELDKEVSESAALLGEKYDVASGEFQMQYTYKAKLGEAFGAKMFSAIINEYDEFLLDKYYNRSTIADFSKIVKDTTADYIDIADVMSTNLESIISTLDDMSSWNPDFRSKRTGYSFGDLADLYQNLFNIQYAKYYGNVRAGNLAKDAEMVIKSYKSKVKDLEEQLSINSSIAQSYKDEISRFYDSYKAAGLYRQAANMQSNLSNTNNRDQDVLEDYKMEQFINTYDNIVLSYSDRATSASDNQRMIEYYTDIITSFENDNVDRATKARLIAKNELVFDEIEALSERYSMIANETMDEFFDAEVNNDLQYLISPEVTADMPVKLIVVFMVVLAFGFLLIAVFIYEITKKYVKIPEDEEVESEMKIIIDTEGMDELHKEIYSQYLNDFKDFYLVYQPIIPCKESKHKHYEAFIRWQSDELGMVSPGKIIDSIRELDLFRALNDWILKNVCENIKTRIDAGEKKPVIHINCPGSEVAGFKLNDLLVKHITRCDIDPGCVCMELDGKQMTTNMEDIIILRDMGIRICIDRFENVEDESETIQVITPDYVKLSLDILNSDIYATSKEDITQSAAHMVAYFSETIAKCKENKVKTFICGVENSSQDKLVSMLSFDYKQGYFYGKPEKYTRA